MVFSTPVASSGWSLRTSSIACLTAARSIGEGIAATAPTSGGVGRPTDFTLPGAPGGYALPNEPTLPEAPARPVDAAKRRAAGSGRLRESGGALRLGCSPRTAL